MITNGFSVVWEQGPSGIRAVLSGTLSTATAAAVGIVQLDLTLLQYL